LDMARIVRGQALSIRRQEYVQAAEAMGVGQRGILLRHVIPNLLGPVVIYMTLLVPQVIILESFLSFLGLGDPNRVTWGSMIAEGRTVLRTAPFLSIVPGVALVLTVLGVYLAGEGVVESTAVRRSLS
ncbi:MAG: ABC transporter permease, partial [Mesorhizobium sp.]